MHYICSLKSLYECLSFKSNSYHENSEISVCCYLHENESHRSEINGLEFGIQELHYLNCAKSRDFSSDWYHNTQVAFESQVYGMRNGKCWMLYIFWNLVHNKINIRQIER